MAWSKGDLKFCKSINCSFEKGLSLSAALKEILGLYQPYEYNWMFLCSSTKYIWQLTKNIAAIVIHMVGIHIQAEMIQANLGFR